jgi:hypothetical protein
VTPPVTVRVAAGVLVVMAIGGLVYGAMGLALMSGIVERFQTAAIGAGVPVDEIHGGSQLLRGVPIAGAFVGVVSALLLAALVVGLLRGNAGVRIAAWVVCGLGVAGGALTAALGFGQRIAEFADDAVLWALNEAHPAWWPWTSAILSVLQLVGYVVVAALLLSPAASAYFRRTPAPPPGAPPGSLPPPVDPTDWQRPQPPTTTPAAM